jgi:hypothetical protein
LARISRPTGIRKSAKARARGSHPGIPKIICQCLDFRHFRRLTSKTEWRRAFSNSEQSALIGERHDCQPRSVS